MPNKCKARSVQDAPPGSAVLHDVLDFLRKRKLDEMHSEAASSIRRRCGPRPLPPSAVPAIAPEQTAEFRKWLLKQDKHVAGLPTCILFANGKPVRSIVGRFDASRLRKFVGSVGSQIIRKAVQPSPAAQQPAPVPVRVQDTAGGDWSEWEWRF